MQIPPPRADYLPWYFIGFGFGLGGLLLKVRECSPGAFDVWGLFYLFRVVGGGVEGLLRKTCITLDDLFI